MKEFSLTSKQARLVGHRSIRDTCYSQSRECLIQIECGQDISLKGNGGLAWIRGGRERVEFRGGRSGR